MVFEKIKTHPNFQTLHLSPCSLSNDMVELPEGSMLTNTHFPSFRSFKETFPFSFYGGVISFFEFKSIIMNGVVTGMSKITQK